MVSHVPTQPFNVNDSSNATFSVVSGVTGKYLNILHLFVSVSTADNITIKRGTTTIFGPHYFGENTGLDLVVHPCKLKLGSGEALQVTKGTASTPVTVSGFYYEE